MSSVFNLQSVIDEHQMWSRRLMELAKRVQSGESITEKELALVEDDKQCQTAQILAGLSEVFPGRFSVETAVILHSTFHGVSELLLRAIQSKAPAEVQLDYKNSLAHISQELVSALTTISKQQ
jgi:hypothetical protein